MSFPTDWDIEKYRVGYESQEHWELRKKFLLQHKNKYPEDKLVCLAQVFYNVEFMGCRYPKETMNMVKILSRGIVEDHREKMKNRLKRTFVGASDAASSKVKGLKRTAAVGGLDNSSGNSVTPQKGASNLQPTQSKRIRFEPETPTPPTNTLTNPTTSKKKKKKSNPDNIPTTSILELPESLEVPEPTSSSIDNFHVGPFQDVILYFRKKDNPKTKIMSTLMFNKVPYEFSSECINNLHQSSVKVRGVEVGSGTGATTAEAQDAAANAAIVYLSKHCHTILIKNSFEIGRKIEKHEIINCPPGSEQMAEPVSDDKASRMMKLMGWSGGGLGKEEQGRTEPVMPVHRSKRAGVGSAVGKVKIGLLKSILQDFMKSRCTGNLVFSNDLDITERKAIHEVARRFGLKSKSRGKGENRFLIISRIWTPKVLFPVLRDSKNKSDKYQLLPPNRLVSKSPKVSDPESSSFEYFPFGKIQDMVLYFREEDEPKVKIQSTCIFNGVPYDFLDRLSPYQSSVRVCGVELGSGTGDTAALARDAAARATITYLSKHCYTILLKNQFVVGRKIERHEIMDCKAGRIQTAKSVSDEKASRMMKAMGWSGGGLGKEEQGRTEPVMPVQQSKRSGVGFVSKTVSKVKIKCLKKILGDFLKSLSTYDIAFSADFDHIERREIIAVTQKLGLRIGSCSIAGNQCLIASRKWAPKLLVSVLRDTTDVSEKYILLPPNSSDCDTS